MTPPEFESVLVVFQNPASERRDAYDDWYTNIHIRDAMRLDGAIATQRFVAHDQQPVRRGKRVVPDHWAHTVYEWESAAKSVEGHRLCAATPAMEISRDCDFRLLRDYFYRPAFLSHGWNRESGFRRGTDLLTAMILPPAGGEDAFRQWFCAEHIPASLALPGMASIGLFVLHHEQSLPQPAHFPMVAFYSLHEATVALDALSTELGGQAATDLESRAEELELTCWKPRIPRLRAEEVVDPSPSAAAAELRARAAYRNRFLSAEELARALGWPHEPSA